MKETASAAMLCLLSLQADKRMFLRTVSSEITQLQMHGCARLRSVEGSRLPNRCEGNPLGWRAARGILSEGAHHLQPKPWQ
jgi:hypothetical protein